MNIKAKMKCSEVEITENGERVKLNAVTCDSEENKTFAKYTPSASVEMWIDNPSARGAFVRGQSYYLTFEPAPEK